MKAKKTVKAKKSGQDTSKKTKQNTPPSIKKQYLKSGGICKVTFTLPKAAAPGAKVVTIAGDFNNWNETEAQMKKLRNGNFSLTVELSSDMEYRYKYLIDSSRWENDWNADGYVSNEFGCDDSLVKV